MDDGLDVDAEFTRIMEEEDRRDRFARGEASAEEFARFAREEIDSPLAPGNLPLHETHRLPTIEQAVLEDTGGFCQRCCGRIRKSGMTTNRGAQPCPGKRTMVLGEDDRLHWVSIPEVG